MWPKKKISVLILISMFVLQQQTAVFSFQNNISAPANTDSSDINSDKSNFDFIPLINEGNLYLENKLYDKAIKNFKKANKFKETSNADKGLGLALFAKAKELDQKMATPIRAFRKKKHFEQSVKFFLKALKLEPNNINIRYHLANVFVYRNHPETLKLAETLLNQVTGTDIAYKDALILLSVVYKNLDQPEKAKATLERYLQIKKDDSRALYYLSLIAIEDDNYEGAEKYYMSSLDNLKDEQALEDIMQDLTFVFSEKDNNEYESTEHKGKFLKKFWLSKDPVPDTRINERLTEHFRRVKYAKTHYTTQSLHGKYDDRGKIYIKYGHPDGNFVNGGSLNVYSNESWTYYWRIGDYRDGLFFDFANKGGKGYVLLNDLRDAVFGIEMTDENYHNLFAERAYIDEKHYGRVGRTRDSQRLFDELLSFRDAKEVMKNSIPAEAYIYYRGARPLQIMLSAASFRGENGKTKYEIYYSFPFEELEFDKSENSKTSSFEEGITVKNLDGAPLYRNYDSYTLTYTKDTNLKKRSFIGQVTFEIPPEKEESLAYVNLVSTVSERVGLAYYELEAKDYRGSSLMMSDIEFSYDIQQTNSTGKFTKNGLRIIPHTGGILDKEENIFVYFEIYSLTLDNDGDARYKIDYTIRKRNPLNSEKPRYFNSLGKEIINKKVKKKEVITTTQTETVRQKDTFNYLLFDMKGLSKGVYDMTIDIKDLTSGETTTSDYSFYLSKK